MSWLKPFDCQGHAKQDDFFIHKKTINISTIAQQINPATPDEEEPQGKTLLTTKDSTTSGWYTQK